MISQKQNALVIDRMKLVDGTMLDSLEMIHEEAVEYFQQLLSKHHERELSYLSNLISKKITIKDNDNLVRVLLELELNIMLKSIPSSISPSFDGFGSNLYVSCWDTIKED